MLYFISPIQRKMIFGGIQGKPQSQAIDLNDSDMNGFVRICRFT